MPRPTSLRHRRLRNSPTHRRRRTCRRNMAAMRTKSTRTCTNASDTAPGSSFRESRPMRWANSHQHWKRPGPISSGSTTWRSLNSSNSGFSRLRRRTSHTMPIISATASWYSSPASSLAARSPRLTCRTASSSQPGVMRKARLKM